MYQATEPFRAQHKGIDIHFDYAGGWNGGDLTSWTSAFTSGTAPDVAEIWANPWVFPEKGFLLDLAPFIRKDNLDMTVWPSGALDYVHVLSARGPQNGGLYYLPAYLNTLAVAVNKGVVSGHGLGFPAPDWTYANWTRLAEALTQRTSSGHVSPRAGMLLMWTQIPPPFLLHAFGGGYVDPTNDLRSGLTGSGTLDFFNWVIPLIKAGVVASGNPWVQNLGSGYCATELYQSAFLVEAVHQFSGLDWDFYLMPVGAAGRFSAGYIDVVGVSAATKQPELAYEFAKWLTWDPVFSAAMMRLSLRSPMRKDQWAQWAHVVQSIAPPLAGKNLQAFTDVATGDQGSVWSGRVFRYDNTGVASILANWWSKMLYRGQDVTTALKQAAQQVDALESIGASGKASKASS